MYDAHVGRGEERKEGRKEGRKGRRDGGTEGGRNNACSTSTCSDTQPLIIETAATLPTLLCMCDYIRLPHFLASIGSAYGHLHLPDERNSVAVMPMVRLYRLRRGQNESYFLSFSSPSDTVVLLVLSTGKGPRNK